MIKIYDVYKKEYYINEWSYRNTRICWKIWCADGHGVQVQVLKHGYWLWKIPAFCGDWEDFIEMIRIIKKSGLFVSAWAFFLNSGRPWEQIINKSEISVIHMLRNLSKQQVEILESIYPVCFCCFNQAVQDCACFCTVGGLNHYEVLSTNGKRPDCLFRSLYWY